jgi:hypothetical protein
MGEPASQPYEASPLDANEIYTSGIAAADDGEGRIKYVIDDVTCECGTFWTPRSANGRFAPKAFPRSRFWHF